MCRIMPSRPKLPRNILILRRSSLCSAAWYSSRVVTVNCSNAASVPRLKSSGERNERGSQSPFRSAWYSKRRVKKRASSGEIFFNTSTNDGRTSGSFAGLAALASKAAQRVWRSSSSCNEAPLSKGNSRLGFTEPGSIPASDNIVRTRGSNFSMFRSRNTRIPSPRAWPISVARGPASFSDRSLNGISAVRVSQGSTRILLSARGRISGRFVPLPFDGRVGEFHS